MSGSDTLSAEVIAGYIETIAQTEQWLAEKLHAQGVGQNVTSALYTVLMQKSQLHMEYMREQNVRDSVSET